MKKYVFLLISLLLLFTCLLAGCNNEKTAVPAENALFGDFSTVDLNGNPVDSQVFAPKKLTMVNIWGTFCNPCIREMPDLAQLNKAFGDDFQVIGIVIDATDRNGNTLPDKKQAAFSIIANTGADYLHLLPSASLNQAYLGTVSAIPETVFVDASGNQVGEAYVGARSYEQWRQIIEDLLEDIQ